MRIVCDTNVLVSGVLFGGNPRRILTLAAQGRINICISTAILAEVEAILLRPKFAFPTAQLSAVLDLFHETFVHVIPSEHFDVVERDPDDNAILEAAVAGGVQTIVSADQDLLRIARWRNIEILSPADFMKRNGGATVPTP